MYDKELVVEILNQIEKAISITLQRFEIVNDVKYFTDTPYGMEKLDSICMQLIAIGESLKNIDKITNNQLLIKYPEIDWKGAKGMRDIISHHYFDIDANEIYYVCDKKLADILRIIKTIKQDIVDI